MMVDAAETRFSHLLQPIRDLTKNWEVDVASQLGEYLDELDQICISYDEGKTTMNFAEAALLIQGSACIYSKKVEYLYSLVYQALDFISNKKRDKQPTSIERDGMDKDVAFGSKNNEAEFLTLDDFTEKNTPNIDIRNDTAKGLEMVPLTPEPLILVDEMEKKKNPLHSHKGEVLASCADFRMNNFTPHANGSIRLYMASTPFEFSHNMHSYVQNNFVGDPNIIPEDTGAHNAPLPPLNLSEVPYEGVSVDGVDGDAGGADVLEAFLPLQEEGDGMEGRSDRRMLRERPAVQPALEQKRALFLLFEENPDPWKCHDPFSTSEDRPLKPGKHFTIPPNVQEVPGNKRKRGGSNKLPEFMSWLTGTLSERPSRKTKKGPTFADLETLYWSHVRERLKCRKKIHQGLARRYGYAYAQRNFSLREAGAEIEEEVHDAERDDELQDHDAGGDDFSNLDNFADEVPAQIAEDQDQFITASQTDRMTYEDLVKRSVELFLVNSEKYAQETVLSRAMKDWEEMIGPHLTAQEEKPAFDIHDYGDRIMSNFSDVGERRTFASIVQGKENHEVCRYMLASLQLANDSTVEIHQRDGLEEAIDTMEMTLLSKLKAHERFKTYSAPSVTDAH